MQTIRPLPRRLSSLFALVLAACGGGGEPSGGVMQQPSPTPLSPPGGGPVVPTSLAIVFPHLGGLTHAETLTVRGTATAPGGVVQVKVHGVVALSTDAFATWQAEVPLALGVQTLETELTDAQGSVTAGPSVVVRREGALPGVLSDMAYDPATGRWYVVDGDAPAVLGFDETAGTSWTVTSNEKGGGLPNGTMVRLALDAAGERVFTQGSGPLELRQVNLLDGTRSEVSSGVVGNGPLPLSPRGYAYHPLTKQVLLTDGGVHALFAIDPTTGDRVIVSGSGVGAGPAFSLPADLALDVPNGRALVVNSQTVPPSLFSVDLATGNRFEVSGGSVGTGPAFVTPYSLAFDPAGGRCFVANNSFPASLVEVDLATGDRTTLSLSGYDALSATSLTWDPVKGRLLCVDPVGFSLFAVDPDSGKVQAVWPAGRGVGATIAHGRGLGLLPDGGTAVTSDYYKGGTLAFVDLATGDRTWLPGSGENVTEVNALELDEANNRVVLGGWSIAEVSLVAVDLDTGVRTLLSGTGLGSGPTFQHISDVVHDPASGRFFVADSQTSRVFTVDPANGDRTVIADALTGTGPVVVEVWSLAWDAFQGRLLVGGTTALGVTLLALDPATLVRTELSSSSVGGGVSNFLFDTLLVGETLPQTPLSTVFGTGERELLSVELVSGDRTAISPKSPIHGPPIGYIGHALAAAGPDRVALLYDDTTNALLAVDLVTGERVILSR